MKATPLSAGLLRVAPDVRELASRALTLLRGWSERALHRSRRERARARVRARSRRMRSVLFVCEGNIYRSPFAAACLIRVVKGRSVVRRVGSAGFVGPKRGSPPDAREAASRYGLDLSRHQSQQLTRELIAQWDFIVVMEANQARRLREKFGVPSDRILVLGDLDPVAIERRSIVDPWSDPNLLGPCYARVERCVRVLAALAYRGKGVSGGSSGELSLSLS